MSQDKKIVVRARAVILHEDKLLVVKHSPEDTFVALPGGHLEWSEDIKECLKREMLEELGVAPEIGRLLYINNFIDKDTTQSIEFFFEVTNSHEYRDIENKTRTHSHELSGIHWVGAHDTVTILPKMLEEDLRIGNILSNQIRYI